MVGRLPLIEELGLTTFRDFPTLRDHRIHLVVHGKRMAGALQRPQRVELDAEERALCEHRDISEAIHRWWDWIPRRRHWALEQDEFRMLNRLCFEELAPDLAAYNDMYEKIAEAVGALDWDYISDGEKSLGYSAFAQAMLELVANFHDSSDPERNASWLQELHSRVRYRYDKDAAKYGNIYIWASANGTGSGTGQLSQNEHTGSGTGQLSQIDHAKAGPVLDGASMADGSKVSPPAHVYKEAREGNRRLNNQHARKLHHGQARVVDVGHTDQKHTALRAWDGRKYETWEEGRDEETIRANAGLNSRLLLGEYESIPASPIEGWTETNSPADGAVREAANVPSASVSDRDGVSTWYGVGQRRTRPGSAVRQVGGGGFVLCDTRGRGLHAPASSQRSLSAKARPQSALSTDSMVAHSRPQSAMELQSLHGFKFAGDDNQRARRPKTALARIPSRRHNVRTSESIYSCKNTLPLRKIERVGSSGSSSSDIQYGVSTVQFLTNDGFFAESVDAVSPEGSLRSAIRPISASISVRVQRMTRVRRARPAPPHSLAGRSFSPTGLKSGFASPFSASLKSLSRDSLRAETSDQSRHDVPWETVELPASHDLVAARHAICLHAQKQMKDRSRHDLLSPSLLPVVGDSRLVSVDDLQENSLQDLRILHGAGSEMPLPQEPSKHDLRPSDNGAQAQEQLGELLAVRRVYGKHMAAYALPVRECDVEVSSTTWRHVRDGGSPFESPLESSMILDLNLQDSSKLETLPGNTWNLQNTSFCSLPADH